MENDRCVPWSVFLASKVKVGAAGAGERCAAQVHRCIVERVPSPEVSDNMPLKAPVANKMALLALRSIGRPCVMMMQRACRWRRNRPCARWVDGQRHFFGAIRPGCWRFYPDVCA